MTIEVKKLSSSDLSSFIEMIALFATVFETKNFRMPDKEYLHGLLSKNNFFVFVALHENKVVGGLTAHELPSYYTKSSEIYLYDLAVKNELQRKGIGRKLLKALSSFCKENNYKEFFVQADVEDIHALEFYKSTGGITKEVFHYSYPIN